MAEEVTDSPYLIGAASGPGLLAGSGANATDTRLNGCCSQLSRLAQGPIERCRPPSWLSRKAICRERRSVASAECKPFWLVMKQSKVGKADAVYVHTVSHSNGRVCERPLSCLDLGPWSISMYSAPREDEQCRHISMRLCRDRSFGACTM